MFEISPHNYLEKNIALEPGDYTITQLLRNFFQCLVIKMYDHIRFYVVCMNMPGSLCMWIST